MYIRGSLVESLPLYLASVNSLAKFVDTIYFLGFKLTNMSPRNKSLAQS